MATATVFDVKSGTRKVVQVGSPDAFSVSPEEAKKGISAWKLLTPTQNFQTFKSPTREITRGEGTKLYTSEGGVNTPISEPSQLAPLTQQGYIDTRRQLDIPVITGGGTVGGLSQQLTSAPVSSAGNVYQRFNDAVTNILLGMKGNGNLDLEQQRNALIRARFTTKSGPTPEELRVLTPEQQSALRSQEAGGIEEQLGGVTSAISTRDKERKFTMDSAISLIERAEKAAQLGYEMSKDEKEQARKGHEYMITNFGSAYLSAMTPEEQKNVEMTLGLGTGTLGKLGKTLKEQTQEKGRYKVIGATLRHGTIMYDSIEGRYVDGKGNEVSSVIVNEAKGGIPISPSSVTPPTVSRTAAKLAQEYALAAYQRATGSVPAKHAKPDIINQWAQAYELESQHKEMSIDPSTFNPFSAPRERLIEEQKKTQEVKSAFSTDNPFKKNLYVPSL